MRLEEQTQLEAQIWLEEQMRRLFDDGCPLAALLNRVNLSKDDADDSVRVRCRDWAPPAPRSGGWVHAIRTRGEDSS